MYTRTTMSFKRKRSDDKVGGRTARRLRRKSVVVVRGGNGDDNQDSGGGGSDNDEDDAGGAGGDGDAGDGDADDASDPSMLLNCHLIRAGVRPAALLEPVDYGDATAAGPRTAKFLASLRAQFPDIRQTVTDYGVFLTPDDDTAASTAALSAGADLSDAAVRGRLLGYPCAADTADNFVIHVMTTYRSEPFAIISNVAMDLSKLDQFRAIAAGANAVIQANKALRADFGEVTVATRKITTILELINKILAAEELTADEMKQLKDALSDEFRGRNQYFIDNFDSIVDVKNPVHIGILLALLCDLNAQPWSPLYPINLLPQYPEIKRGLEGFGTSLLSVLENTKTEKPAIRVAVRRGKSGKSESGKSKSGSASRMRSATAEKKKPWR